MSKKEKLYIKIKRNPNNVEFGEIQNLLHIAGFIERKGKGDHFIFFHPELNGYKENITIPYNRPIKVVYIKKALKLLEKLGYDEKKTGGKQNEKY